MKVEEITKLITDNTKDGVVDYGAINTAINSETDALIDKKLGKAKETLTDEIKNDFIKEQGFDNVDQFTAFVKNTKSGANELTEKVSRLETENQRLTGELETAQNTALQSQRAKIISGLNIAEPFQGYVTSEIEKMVTDKVDFETAASTFVKANPQFASETGRKSTKPFKKEPLPPSDGDGVIGALLDRHPDLKE